ncbi:MAG: DUF2784 domain-containing protein, partial [Porticoccaceae bacterium]|nr:DUF2784 domain-containing protein [Porticoccaceae bacterium]
MIYSLLADLVVVIHLLFIPFAVFGALLVLRWRWLLWLHLPAITWVIVLELNSLICPLTPLENHLRHAAGEAGYSGGFIEHYLIPIIYPAGLTPAIQWTLGISALSLNLLLYGLI